MASNYHYAQSFDPTPFIYGGGLVGTMVTQDAQSSTITGLDGEGNTTTTTFITNVTHQSVRHFGPYSYFTGSEGITSQEPGETANISRSTTAVATTINGFPYIQASTYGSTTVTPAVGSPATTTASGTALEALQLFEPLNTHTSTLLWNAEWSGYSASSSSTVNVGTCQLPHKSAMPAGLVERTSVPEPLFNITAEAEVVRPWLHGITQLPVKAMALLNGVPGLAPLVGFSAPAAALSRGELGGFPSFTVNMEWETPAYTGSFNIGWVNGQPTKASSSYTVPATGPQTPWTRYTTTVLTTTAHQLATVTTQALTLYQSFSTSVVIDRFIGTSMVTSSTSVSTTSTLAVTKTVTTFTEGVTALAATTTQEVASPHGVAQSTWEVASGVGDVFVTTTFARLYNTGGASLLLYDQLALNPLTPGAAVLTVANPCGVIAGVQTWTQQIAIENGQSMGTTTSEYTETSYSSTHGETTNGTVAVKWSANAPAQYGVLWELGGESPTAIFRATEGGYLPFGATETTMAFLMSGVSTHDPADFSSKANPPYPLTGLAVPCWGKLSGWLTAGCGNSRDYPRFAMSEDSITGLNSTRTAYLGTIETHGVWFENGGRVITRSTVTYTHFLTLALPITVRTYYASSAHTAGFAGAATIYFPPGIWDVTLDGATLARFTADDTGVNSQVATSYAAWRYIPYYAASAGAQVPGLATATMLDGFIEPVFYLE